MYVEYYIVSRPLTIVAAERAGLTQRLESFLGDMVLVATNLPADPGIDSLIEQEVARRRAPDAVVAVVRRSLGSFLDLAEYLVGRYPHLGWIVLNPGGESEQALKHMFRGYRCRILTDGIINLAEIRAFAFLASGGDLRGRVVRNQIAREFAQRFGKLINQVDSINRVDPARNVVVRGGTSSDRRLFADYIHHASREWLRPLIRIQCVGGMNRDELQSETSTLLGRLPADADSPTVVLLDLDELAADGRTELIGLSLNVMALGVTRIRWIGTASGETELDPALGDVWDPLLQQLP